MDSIIVHVSSQSRLQSGVSLSERLKILYPTAAQWTPKKVGTYRLQSFDLASTLLIEVPQGEDPETMAQVLSQVPGVRLAEPNYPVVAFTESSDPLRYLQTYLYTDHLQMLQSLVAYREVLVAVVDSGIDYYHVDLKDKIYVNTSDALDGSDNDGNGFVDDIYGYNFFEFYKGQGRANPNDGLGHGTHITGIIAAKSGNGLGVSGVSPYVKILNVRFLDDRGYGNQYDAATAIRYAVDMGAKIVNCSWGYFKLTSVLEDAIRYALDHGVIVVAAAGNSGTGIAEYPAAYPGVISVGSVSLSGAKSYFSSYGKVDTAMYGESVYSTLPNNQYGTMSGTSQSTALVTGILSKLMSHLPSANSDAVVALYNQVCQNPSAVPRIGNGVFSASVLYDVLSYVPELYDQAEIPVTPVNPSSVSSVSADLLAVSRVQSFPNPYVSTLGYIGFESTKIVTVSVRVFDLTGRLVRTFESLGSPGYNRIPWDLRSDNGTLLENGSYLYVLEARAGDQVKTVRGKFAVLM